MAVAPAPAVDVRESSKSKRNTGSQSAQASPPSSPPNSSSPTKSRRKKMNHPGFFRVIAQALHPKACLTACHGQVLDEVDMLEDMKVDEVMPDILAGLSTNDDDEARFAALEALHILVDKDRSHNRIPVVCNSKWNIVGELVKGLKVGMDLEERRLICLILNNLSIPFDNKAVMVLGPNGTNLVQVLLDTINGGNPETYLCCVCLMNLSILEDSKKVLTSYIPPTKLNNAKSEGGASSDPLENPRSLLRTLEHMMAIYSTFLTSPQVVSVESQAVLWSMGLLRNLSTQPENAVLIAQTTIPSLAGSCIQNSPNPLCKWKRDSLEDMCLGFLVCLVQSSEAIRILKKSHNGLISSLKDIAGEPGIHGMRASLVSNQLASKD